MTAPNPAAIKTRLGALVCRVENDPNAFGVLSTGEQLAVALVLNRFDWLPHEWNSMLEAVNRIGPTWGKAALDIQREGWNHYRAAPSAADPQP